MINSILLPWLGGALILFWAVGAYNRLVRLRAAVGKAFVAMDDLLLRHVIWIQSCVPDSIRENANTHSAEAYEGMDAAWSRLFSASEQVGVALAQTRAKPVDGVAMASLVMAHAALGAAWDGAMQELSAAGATPSAGQLQARRTRFLNQMLPLRDAFNEVAAAYNTAIRGFPALLLAKLFGFRPAGTIR